MATKKREPQMIGQVSNMKTREHGNILVGNIFITGLSDDVLNGLAGKSAEEKTRWFINAMLIAYMMPDES